MTKIWPKSDDKDLKKIVIFAHFPGHFQGNLFDQIVRVFIDDLGSISIIGHFSYFMSWWLIFIANHLTSTPLIFSLIYEALKQENQQLFITKTRFFMKTKVSLWNLKINKIQMEMKVLLWYWCVSKRAKKSGCLLL